MKVKVVGQVQERTDEHSTLDLDLQSWPL